MSVAVFEPYSLIFDRDGQPLENGYLWFGTAAQNPQTNPIVVYWDQAGTQIAAQPIRTSGGYPMRNGAPARVYVNADDYSLTIRDKNQRLVSSQLNAAVFGSAFVGFMQAGTGAVTRTVQAKLRDVVNAADFGVVADGLTDNSAYLAAALASLSSGGTLMLPRGTTLFSSTLNMPTAATRIAGVGDASVLSYTGAGVAINFNGKAYCAIESLKLMTTTGTVGVDLPILSHFWQVIGAHIRGFSTAGVRGTSVFYGTLTQSDVEQNAVGLLGVQEFNGNFIHSNSFRGNLRGVYLRDVALNSDGNQIINNEMEDSGRAGTVAFIDIEGADGTIIQANRMEASVAGLTGYVYVHGGTGIGIGNQVVNNYMAGGAAGVPSIVIGAGGGSGIKHTIVRDNICLSADGSSNAIVIRSDAQYTSLTANRRYLGDGAYSVSNAGSNTSLTWTDDQAFTATLTGCTTTPTAGWKYQIANGVVTIWAQLINGISNSVACTITGLPTLARPVNTQTVLVPIQNNGAWSVGTAAIDSAGLITLSTSVISGGAFAAANGKGLGACAITYPIN